MTEFLYIFTPHLGGIEYCSREDAKIYLKLKAGKVRVSSNYVTHKRRRQRSLMELRALKTILKKLNLDHLEGVLADDLDNWA